MMDQAEPPCTLQMGGGNAEVLAFAGRDAGVNEG